MSTWRANLLPFCGYSAALNLLFIAVYGTTNALTARRAQGLSLYADWELAIPFVPGFIVVYASIAVLLNLPLFMLQRHELRPFAMAFALATLAAGVSFVLLPATLGFARPVTVPGFEAAYALLYRLDLPHNLVPSLHVTYSTLTVLAVSQGKRLLTRGILRTWLAAIAVAVLLTHQHHVLDVVSGLLLGAICYRAYRRLIQ